MGRATGLNASHVRNAARLRNLEPSAETATHIEQRQRTIVVHHDAQDALGRCRIGGLLTGKLATMQVLVDVAAAIAGGVCCWLHMSSRVATGRDLTYAEYRGSGKLGKAALAQQSNAED
jgi:hypothetical protein